MNSIRGINTCHCKNCKSNFSFDVSDIVSFTLGGEEVAESLIRAYYHKNLKVPRALGVRCKKCNSAIIPTGFWLDTDTYFENTFFEDVIDAYLFLGFDDSFLH